MADVEDYLTKTGYEEFKTAKYLTEEESRRDPESDPFRSKYKAREILNGVREKLKGFVGEERGGGDKLCKCLIAAVDLRLGVVYAETEELSAGEECLTRCLARLEEYKLDKEACNVYQDALNQLGVLWSCRQEPHTALQYLQQAENLYGAYKQSVGGSPFSLDELFRPGEDDENKVEHERNERFESAYTHTLYYIAQIYASMEDNEKSAKYCHETLLRQLESNQYNPLEWSINAAGLSQYYITVESFCMARHCLASASHVFQEVLSKQANHSEASDSAENEKDDIGRRKADIDRCWAKYGLSLLESSKEFQLVRLVGNLDVNEERATQLSQALDLDHNADKTVVENFKKSGYVSGDKTKDLLFKLELTALEEQITSKYVKDFSEARQVFLCIQKWLTEAKDYYTLDGHCTDYVKIVQDHSNAFKLLACFEHDFERQCKMHKRRVDMLSNVLQELNPQFYLLICRQLMYELGETFSNMLDLKLAIIEEESSAYPSAVKKINMLAEKSISHFQAYLDSLKGGKSELPDKFHETDLRPALVAVFHIARLHSKYRDSGVMQKIARMQNSLDCYQYIVDYCERHSSGEEAASSELNISREMVQLLPLKMKKVRQEREL